MLSYDHWPPAAYADIVLVVPSGYLAYQAYANPPGQVVDARTIRYPGSAPPGSYPGNDFALTVPPPPPPSGSVSGGSCPQPCLVLMGGLLNPPSVGLSVTVDIPAGRDDIVRVELELDHTDPADGRTLTYSLPVSAGQTETVFTRASTGDPTFGEKALGSWTAKARLVSAAAGPGEWGAVGLLASGKDHRTVKEASMRWRERRDPLLAELIRLDRRLRWALRRLARLRARATGSRRRRRRLQPRT
jgi:hypothetical protein